MTKELIRLFDGIPSAFDATFPSKLFNDHGSWDVFFPKDSFPYDVIVETDKEGETQKTIMQYAVAGVNNDAIDVSVNNNTLQISINYGKENVSPKQQENIHYVHKGISTRSMVKKFTLGENVDTENIVSELENGILTIILPVKEKPPEKVKKINVNVK